ncbi:MAG: hypothetical protein ACE5H5_07680 [Nitrospinota bacterium]
MGLIGDARAGGPLSEALHDPTVAQEAAVALGRIGSPAGFEALASALVGEE